MDKLLNFALRRPLSILTLAVLDTFALLTGPALALYLVEDGRRAEEMVRFAPILLVVWLVIFAAHDLYDRASNRRNPVALLKAILSGSGLLIIGDILYPELGLILKEMLVGTFFVLLLGVGMRLLYEQGIKLAYRQELGLVPTLLVGGDEERRRVRMAVRKSPGPCTYVGELPSNDEGVDLPALRRVLDRTRARQVIVAGAEHFPEGKFMELMRSCRLRRVGVRVVPSAVTLMGGTSVLSQEAGVPLLELSYPTLDGPQRTLKRLLDILGALSGLVLLAPLLLIVALAIRATSPGPIFFRQKRVGADEKIFLCYKFRSMYEDAERRQAQFEAHNEAEGAIFKIKDDPRITPVGRFLRRWSIDELPQLINVLKGEMSLVGPRPLPVRDFLLMEEVHKCRLGAVPGMTGYWQISGRSDISFEDMVRLDLYYIENWSLSLDIKIILRTLRVVLHHQGAY